MFILRNLTKYILGKTQNENDIIFNAINRLTYGLYWFQKLHYAFVYKNYFYESHLRYIYIYNRMKVDQQICKICFLDNNETIDDIRANLRCYHIEKSTGSYVIINKILNPNIIRKKVYYYLEPQYNSLVKLVEIYYNSDWLILKTDIFHHNINIMYDIIYIPDRIDLKVSEFYSKKIIKKHVYIKQTE